jgi:putative OPT family oligopeptide transporter
VSFDAIGFILGLGYVMGLRSSLILRRRRALQPGVGAADLDDWRRTHERRLSRRHSHREDDAGADLPQLRSLRRRGAIATAGIFGIIKSIRIVAASFGVALRSFRVGEAVSGERTDRDLPIVTMLIGVVIGALGIGILLGTLSSSPAVIAIGVPLALVFSFFFTSVAANAIATTARNPVSGMTMLTIIISSIVLVRFGVSGRIGMFFVMALAGMVCTALSVSGQTMTDFKTGYWLGSTPANQQKVKFLGVVAASVAMGLTIVMLARAFQFGEAAPGDPRVVLPSPQASIMKALVEGFMSR